MSHNNKKLHKGFAMLITVVVVSLILSIALGISNLSFKQTILSTLAKDSQISFYEADAAVECAMYYDLQQNLFPIPTDPTSLSTISCGAASFSINQAQSATNYFVFEQSGVSGNNPCSTISIDKTVAGTTKIQTKGYNICVAHPRKVERALEVTY